MEDLSSLVRAEYALTAGESMSGTNTVSDGAKEHAMSAPGTNPVDYAAIHADGDDPSLGVSSTHAKPTTIGKYTTEGG